MKGLLLGAAFVVLWASAFTAIKGMVPEWPPLWALTARFLLVLPVLLAIVWWRRAPWPARCDLPRIALMGALGSAGYLGCSWVSGRTVPSGLIALLAATAPLFVALGERVLRGRRLATMAWVGLALGWAGVAVLGVGRAGQGAPIGGLLIALCGGLCLAGGMLAFAPARGRVDPWTANALQAVVAGGLMLASAALLEPHTPAAPSTTLLLTLAYSVLAIGVLGYALFFEMLRRLPASTAASLQLLAPPLAAVFGWELLGERLGWTDLAGGALTLAGLLLVFRAPKLA